LDIAKNLVFNEILAFSLIPNSQSLIPSELISVYYIIIMERLFFFVLAFIFAACSNNAAVSEIEQSSSSEISEISSSSSIQLSSSAQSSSSSALSSSSIILSSSSVLLSSSSSIRSSSSIQSSSSVQLSSSSSSITTSSSSSVNNCAGQITKACIDAEIEANWQRLGYSSKPTKVIALTFDDGPCNKTQDLLAILANKEVKATFFVIGSNITDNQAAAQAIFAGGHELGNHSDGYSANPNRTSVEGCSNKIKNITGSNPTLFRAPELNYGSVVSVCRDLNLPLIGTNCDSQDYNASANVQNNVRNCAKDGGIVLMHEGNTSGERTLPNLGNIIDWLRSQGYWILPVSQLAVYKGTNALAAGVTYNSF
jgi:peptidoglycan/xylan/chitin deacetylase (PgdA/CDA1 family)